MNIIQDYLDNIEPLNILSIIKPDALKTLLNGYSYALESGITIVYPISPEINLDTLEREDARDLDAPKTYHDLCANWRHDKKCGMESECILADKCETIKYFNGEVETVRVYCCQPLGLWDMSYPIKIESRVIGVLFAGQMILSSITYSNLKNEIKKYGKNGIIDWGSYPKTISQTSYIENNIKSKKISNKQKTQLLEIVNNPGKFTNSKYSSIEDFIYKIDEFIKFGDITQALINQLFEANLSLIEQKLIRDVNEAINEIDLTRADIWWGAFRELLEQFILLPEIDKIRIYVRKKSRFNRIIAIPAEIENGINLLARDIIPALPTGSLVNISISHPNIVERIGIGDDDVWGYRSQTGSGRELTSTLILVKGSILHNRKDFLKKVFNVLCNAADISQLFFLIRQVHDEFKHNVALVGHSFRTPQQNIQFILEDLKREVTNLELPELIKIIRNGMDQIDETKTYLYELLESPQQDPEDFDLMELIEEIIQLMKPSAERYQCKIIKIGEWANQIVIYGVRNRIKRALINLLDNAIKYSYEGQRRDEFGIASGLYEVRLQIINRKEVVEILFTNYGVGIPEIIMGDIRDYGYRANVEDEKRERTGFGLGLPYAIDELEEAGAYLHVTSVPAKGASKKEREKYHRFITTVEVGLPKIKQPG